MDVYLREDSGSSSNILFLHWLSRLRLSAGILAVAAAVTFPRWCGVLLCPIPLLAGILVSGRVSPSLLLVAWPAVSVSL